MTIYCGRDILPHALGEIEGTDQFAEWYWALTDDEQRSVNVAVDLLGSHGPGLGRPLVDTLQESRHSHMKELRPRGGHLRVLFAFDPRRTAILLIGGDKRDRWQQWYQEMIPIADRLYDEHLETLRREGHL